MNAGPSGPRSLEAEFRAVGDAVDDESAVGRVDHVRQALDRVDQVHIVSERDVRVVQRLPLGDGLRRVGGVGGLHPRVDRVADREVLGTAHQVRAVLLNAGGRGLGHGLWPCRSSGRGVRSGHPAPPESGGGRCPGARRGCEKPATRARRIHSLTVIAGGRQREPTSDRFRRRRTRARGRGRCSRGAL